MKNVATVQKAMPNGLQTIAKRFSGLLTVIYFLGLATLSSGKYASLHDRLLQSKRDPSSPCHLRCASDFSKVVSFEECVASCQRNVSLNRDTMYRNRKKRDGSSVRQQRSAENRNECMTSPAQSKNEPHKVEIHSVKFREKDIDVVWENVTSSKTDYNWSAYALIYKIRCDGCSDDALAKCKIIPKNQTNYSVPLAKWEKPEYLFAAVVTFPYHRKAQVTLHTFSSKAQGQQIPMPTEAKKDTAKLVGSIVGGVVAGVVILLLLFALVKKRPCRGSTRYMPPPAPPRPEEKKGEKEQYYTCYYPESDAFRDRVASIVNYFRQNGYNVIMDVMVSEEITSQGPTRWGESQIRKANKVLIFLSPGLIKLALDGMECLQSQDTNRVWIELEVLRDLYTCNRSASKMVCLTLPDMPLTSEPLPLWAKVSYKWPDDAMEIFKRLNDRPKILAM